MERVFNLGDRKVGSIMTHRSDMVWLDLNDSLENIKKLVEANLYNVYPVSSGKLDDLLGVVHLKDLFGKLDTPGFSLQHVIRPAHYVPENQSVYNVLEQIKQTRVHSAIVTDEFGSVQGIVTLKDIMEGLIGQVPEQGE